MAVCTAVLLGAGTACSSGSGSGGTKPPVTDVRAVAVAKLATAWSAKDAAAFAAQTDDSAAAAKAFTAMAGALQLGATSVRPSGSPTCTDSGCRQELSVREQIGGVGTWAYTTTVSTTRSGSGYSVHWRPAVLHAGMTSSEAFARVRRLPARAPILDRSGIELTKNLPVYRIGVVPGKAKPASYPRIASLLGVDRAGLVQRAKAAQPDWFVDVITLRAADYAPVRDRLLAIPGVAVNPARMSLAPSAGWGRGVLGAVAPATKESLANAGLLAEASDTVGDSGLQATYEKQLAGTPGGYVQLVDAQSGAPRRVLWRVKPRPGTPLRTTLSQPLQAAAENAVAGQPSTTAFVAVDTRNGQVLADVNGPEVTSYNTGFVGEYAPGSTMKILTSAALIENGQRITAPAACPSSTVVDGKTFKNYEHESLPAGSTYADAIAFSCNTTVIERRGLLGDSTLHDVVTQQFGVGHSWSMPIPGYSGSVPAADGQTDKAAEMIGQGRVLMSPLQMALVAATARSGTSRAPSLAAGKDGAVLGHLPAAVAANLRTMMRLVVTEGTASSLRGLPGDIGAKTGTAEFGTGNATHAWLIGYRGDVAWACLVVTGATGNGSAGPVVREFLTHTPMQIP